MGGYTSKGAKTLSITDWPNMAPPSDARNTKGVMRVDSMAIGGNHSIGDAARSMSMD